MQPSPRFGKQDTVPIFGDQNIPIHKNILHKYIWALYLSLGPLPNSPVMAYATFWLT